MIERLWLLLTELWGYLSANFDPIRDTIDIVFVTLGIYWLLLLIRGTRAVQILVGLVVLIAASVAADLFQLVTLRMVLHLLLANAALIFIVLFQHDIRRALGQVGRGFFRPTSDHEASQIVEEIVRAAQELTQRRLGALIVLERETKLEDQIESGTTINAEVSKELLTSLFLPQSPLHDGAALIQQGHIASAGCILPLTLSEDLPAGVGTRHRAAVGITEETDALVIVVSEETGSISIVMGGEMLFDLPAPQLRKVLRDIVTGERRDLPSSAESGEETEAGESASESERRARARWAR